MKGKTNIKSILSAAVVIVMTLLLTLGLISCGVGDSVDSVVDTVKGETILETNEEGETLVVATDKNGETVVYETGKDGKIKESRKAEKSGDKSEKSGESSAKATKATQSTTKATTAATTAATQAQVCYISIDGYCSGKAISIQGGDTAYSILKRSGASVSGSSSYVKGINGLFEFDKGPQSGWKYSVNGYTPNVGAGSYGVSAGDSISWYYVTSY